MSIPLRALGKPFSDVRYARELTPKYLPLHHPHLVPVLLGLLGSLFRGRYLFFLLPYSPFHVYYRRQNDFVCLKAFATTSGPPPPVDCLVVEGVAHAANKTRPVASTLRTNT